MPNPCWPLSYSQEVQWNSVHTGPCTVSDDTVDIPNPDHVFNITGTSNPTACMRLVQSLLNSSSSCSFFNNSPKRAAKPLQTRFLVGSHLLWGRQFVLGTQEMGPVQSLINREQPQHPLLGKWASALLSATQALSPSPCQWGQMFK